MVSRPPRRRLERSELIADTIIRIESTFDVTQFCMSESFKKGGKEEEKKDSFALRHIGLPDINVHQDIPSEEDSRREPSSAFD